MYSFRFKIHCKTQKKLHFIFLRFKYHPFNTFTQTLYSVSADSSNPTSFFKSSTSKLFRINNDSGQSDERILDTDDRASTLDLYKHVGNSIKKTKKF